jgi:hypothetical protein
LRRTHARDACDEWRGEHRSGGSRRYRGPRR